MHGLAGGWFWCPRCGTIRERGNEHGDQAPRLVESVRTYLKRNPELEVKRRFLDKTMAEQCLLPDDLQE